MPKDHESADGGSGGIHVGDVGGNLSFSALGDIVGGDKIVNITEVIQISVETITQRPLIGKSPYRGLDRFEERDRDLFFGRDQFIKSLLAQLGASNILLVLGTSGSGKSSLVRAGVLPALTTLLGGGFRPFTFVPDINPFESLRGSLHGGGFSQTQTRELAEAQPDTPAKLIHKLRRDGEQWVLFVDQFEEIFTRSDEPLRQSFLAALLRLARDSASPAKLVLAMRADFFERFSPFPDFAKLIARNIALVADMHADELRLAIEQPAARHGVVFEQGLVEEIIKDLQGQAGVLPLLQYTLDLLWQEEVRLDGLAGRHLSIRAYRELGGVRGALQKRADDIFAAFGDNGASEIPSSRQEIVRRIFLRLVDITGTEGSNAVWRPVRRRAPMRLFADAREKEILHELVNQKMLVSNREQADARTPEGGTTVVEATVEVAHEALFTCWDRLRRWIDGGQQVIFVKNRLADDARRWQRRQGQNPAEAGEELLGGSRLAQALDMRARGDFVTIFGGLDELETQFLDASAAQRERHEKEEQERRQRELESARKLAEAERNRAEAQARASRRQRYFLYGLAVLLIGMTLAAVFSLTEYKFAQKRAREAKEAASQAEVSLARLPMEKGNTSEELADLAQAMRLNPENHEAVSLTTDLLLYKNFPFPLGVFAHKGDVYNAQFSPDGKRIVTASGDKTARLWDAATGEPIGQPMTHEAGLFSAQFSPDGRRVVTASEDKTARLWDAATGKPIGQPMAHEAGLFSAQFSPDGQRVVTASLDRTARLWNAATGEPIGQPMKHDGVVYSAQFSPDGRRVVTASEDKTARLWDAATGEPLGRPMKHEARVNSAQFSPDGRRVVTASGDQTARLWDAATGDPIGQPMKHDYEVSSAQFSPDGQLVVTASGDQTARLWDGVTGEPIGQPMKHDGVVYSAQFSPDGQRVVTASEDKTARLWDAATGKLLGQPMKHDGVVYSARFSPDGREVVTAALDKTARLWDAATGKFLGEPMKHEDEVLSAQFSVDGDRIATASMDKTARLWDAATGKPLGQPMKHDGVVYSARFSPDGRRVVTAAVDKTARLWDAATGESLGQPMKHEDEVYSAWFSPDGQRVVTGSGDQTARLWDAATGKPLGEPMKHDAVVYSAQFSPDGRRAVTASADQTARLWDASTGKALGEPMKHEGIVCFVQFSPDGRKVVTASWDKTARLWDAATGKPLGEPMKHAGSVYSAQFSPDGQKVVTASADQTARLWNAATGEPIGQPMKHGDGVHSAQFSPDGRRVVTMCGDNTVRLWDAATGDLLGESMQHEGSVHSAQFSPDGQRVLTASGDQTARLWDAPSLVNKDTEENVLQLAELAQAIGGDALVASGEANVLHALTPAERMEVRKSAAAKFQRSSSPQTPLQEFMRWLVSDARSRTISPFAKTTVHDWIEDKIKEGKISGLREALQVEPDNPRVTAHLGLCLARYAMDPATDADEARRASAEARFLTEYANKLAPQNEEIKQLRGEVARLLQPKSN